MDFHAVSLNGEPYRRVDELSRAETQEALQLVTASELVEEGSSYGMQSLREQLEIWLVALEIQNGT